MLVDSLALFQDLGIDFISYKENIDTTTSMGRLIFHINSAYAEFERIIRDRVIAGIKDVSHAFVSLISSCFLLNLDLGLCKR